MKEGRAARRRILWQHGAGAPHMIALPSGVNVADRIGRWSAETPDAAALIEGGRKISYRDFDDAVWRTAAAFKAEGAHCRALLGARAPRVIGIVPALPRSGAGKILKRELAKRLMEAREAAKGGRSFPPLPMGSGRRTT